MLEKLLGKRRKAMAVFGLEESKFRELSARMGQMWIKRLERRKDRVRAVGGGKPSAIRTGEQKLAFILFYLKVYPTFDVMSVFCGIDASECCRWVHKLMPVLEELLGQKLAMPKRKISSMEEFAAAFPQAVEVIIDGMERPVQRAKKKRPSASTTRAKRRGIHERRCLSWMESVA